MTNSREFDVVVIGSGAGGGAAAWALAGGGASVLVLEAGPEYDPQRDYRLHLAAWENGGLPDRSQQKRPYTFGPLQDLEPRWKDLRSWNHIGGNMNPTDGRVGYQYSHVRGVGGTTLHYTGSAHRLHPQTMNMRTRFGVAADWPLSYAELDRITARPSV
jgi:choline dehydrogenase-like flavoprotein